MTDKNSTPEAAAGGSAKAPTLVTPNMLRSWPLPEPNGTKYSRGQSLIIGGDRATPGAAMLAGLAALRVGSGRLTLGVAKSVAASLAVAVPESGTVELADTSDGCVSGEGAAKALAKDLDSADAVLVGPGLGSPEGAEKLLAETIDALGDGIPLVLDAFGVTVLPQMTNARLEAVHGRLVLTPNQNELAYLVDADEIEDDDVCGAVIDASHRFGAVIGCADWVAQGDAVWQMTTGDTGLGTSGSGDVMAGAVVGLLSRGADLAQSILWGKHLHAAAGDHLAARYGRIGFLASELLPQLPIELSALRGD